ncbi:hypothetical protein A4G27_17890 [Mycobacterium kansasii]|nr:hypothetical protein A4G27_17890 [Mycobacterium kansasii]
MRGGLLAEPTRRVVTPVSRVCGLPTSSKIQGDQELLVIDVHVRAVDGPSRWRLFSARRSFVGCHAAVSSVRWRV